ncbi:hypothetical protein [Limibacillus sp. MBR-115]|jgi:hypothetical protein|uniref:hypothetical protein n=1 Tax=Limibacillus sp. MBR-115 TaxID=3156465 RepID=UPI0033946EFD
MRLTREQTNLAVALLGGSVSGLLGVRIGDPLERIFGNGGFPGDNWLALLYPQFWVLSLIFAGVGYWILRRLWPYAGRRLLLIFPSSVMSYWVAYIVALEIGGVSESLAAGGAIAGALGATITLGPFFCSVRLPHLAKRLGLAALAGAVAGTAVELIPVFELTGLYAVHVLWQSSVLASLMAWPEQRAS